MSMEVETEAIPPIETRSGPVKPVAPRLASLDALRGFDMFWIVVGMNPITIYICAHQLIDFEYTAEFLFDGALNAYTVDPLKSVLGVLGFLLLEWLFLYFLYRKKVFLRG